MKNLLLFLSFIFFFDTINANSYQRDVWKFLDKSYKSLLTDPKQAVDYTLQAFDILKQTTDSNLIVSTRNQKFSGRRKGGNSSKYKS